MLVYKVLEKDNGKLKSPLSPLRVSYEVGKRTTAPAGGLFTFDTKHEAEIFAKHVHQIFRKTLGIFLATGSKELQLPHLYDLEKAEANIERVAEVWQNIPKDYRPLYQTGTRAFRHLIIIREV